MAVRDVVQAAAGVGGGDKLYVEDVFSTYLYTGNGSTQTITNGIDLDGEGGLVWIKSRSAAFYNVFTDTERGATKNLYSNTTDAEITVTNRVTSFNSDGFTLGDQGYVNSSAGYPYASWTFRKAPKFFDVVTYTGTGNGTSFNHSLESTPAVVIIKRTDTAGYNWLVYHKDLTPNNLVWLNLTSAQINGGSWISVSSSTISFPTSYSDTSTAGGTYVAYLFAHDAGGFGDDGLQNVISCGSYVGNGSATGPEITLGWEPQWVLVKRATGSTANWCVQDVMRGMSQTSNNILFPNLSNSEQANAVSLVTPTASGFNITSSSATFNASGSTYIYIAIRRGPMKTPESGTEVFTPLAWPGSQTYSTVTGIGFPSDTVISKRRDSSTGGEPVIFDRLRGGSKVIYTLSTTSEQTQPGVTGFDTMDGYKIGTFRNVNSDPTYNPTAIHVHYSFKRAPGFFDMVCYTGTGSARTVNHNLGVAPEMIIVKSRTGIQRWIVYHSGNTPNPSWRYLELNSSEATASTTAVWNDTEPTDTVFTVGYSADTNYPQNYIAYLFATLAGVSKVGSYTGTGADINIDCGFSAGARFVLIKRTDSTGDWYVWDSARGIVSGNDPFFKMNTINAEATSTDYIDPLASGFTVTSSAPADLNASGGNYIFLAIA